MLLAGNKLSNDEPNRLGDSIGEQDIGTAVAGPLIAIATMRSVAVMSWCRC